MGKSCVFNSHGINLSFVYDEEPPKNLDVSHCHDMYEAIFITSGKGRFVVEGTLIDIKPKTLLFIRPYEYHCVILESGVPYERQVINFSPSALVEDTARLLNTVLLSEDSVKFYSAKTVPDSVVSIFDRMEASESIPQSQRASYIKMLLSELILLTSVSEGESLSRSEGELGARVIRYLNENITRDVSLDKLARRFFVSKYYLCRAFKKHNGISVHGYVNQKRVMLAKQLIESGETASAAAYKVGFGDYSAFYRAYVKILGKSPTREKNKD